MAGQGHLGTSAEFRLWTLVSEQSGLRRGARRRGCVGGRSPQPSWRARLRSTEPGP